MADGKTFELKHPFTGRGDQRITTFTMRDPNVGDLKRFVKKAQSDPIGAIQSVLSNLSDTNEEIMEQVHIRDFKTMREWFEDFFADEND